MRHGDFEVIVTGGKEDGQGYVEMKHGQRFGIILKNSAYKDADAEVWLDGKMVGNIRVDGFKTVMIERPINDNGVFTAYKRGTSEALSLGITGNDEDSGLIKVVFRPGTKPTPVWSAPMSSSCYHDCIRGVSFEKGIVSGGVGLSGKSDQKFKRAYDLVYEGFPTTLYLRIVFRDEDPRPLRSMESYSSRYPEPKP